MLYGGETGVKYKVLCIEIIVERFNKTHHFLSMYLEFSLVYNLRFYNTKSIARFDIAVRLFGLLPEVSFCL